MIRFSRYKISSSSKKWCQISAYYNRCIDEREKFFCSQTGRVHQSFGRTISFQTAMISAVTERSIRVDTHMFNDPTMHGTPLMEMVNKYCTIYPIDL